MENLWKYCERFHLIISHPSYIWFFQFTGNAANSGWEIGSGAISIRGIHIGPFLHRFLHLSQFQQSLSNFLPGSVEDWVDVQNQLLQLLLEISKAEITGSSGLKSVTTVCGFHQLRTSTWWVKKWIFHTVHMHFWKKKVYHRFTVYHRWFTYKLKETQQEKSCFQCSRNVHQILSF